MVIFQRQMDDKIRENHAFELLFLHVGLQLFTDAESAIESLQVGLNLLITFVYLSPFFYVHFSE